MSKKNSHSLSKLDVNKLYKQFLKHYRDPYDALIGIWTYVEEAMLELLDEEEQEIYFLLLDADYIPINDEKELLENFSLYNKQAHKIARRVIKKLNNSLYVKEIREIKKRLNYVD